MTCVTGRSPFHRAARLSLPEPRQHRVRV